MMAHLNYTDTLLSYYLLLLV